jgi:hypothetical protein
MTEQLNIGYTVKPTEKLSLDQWLTEFKVGKLHVNKQPIHNANEMMKQYSSQENYLSKMLKIVQTKLCLN